ncbi:2182_t:CDS:1, partial [Acaulospora colombiana]
LSQTQINLHLTFRADWLLQIILRVKVILLSEEGVVTVIVVAEASSAMTDHKELIEII